MSTSLNETVKDQLETLKSLKSSRPSDYWLTKEYQTLMTEFRGTHK